MANWKEKMLPAKISFLQDYDTKFMECMQNEIVKYHKYLSSIGHAEDHGFNDHVVFTGSAVNGAHLSRMFKKPGVYEFELDVMIILGDIPKENQHIIEEIGSLPGYFYVHRGNDILSCVHSCFNTEYAELRGYIYDEIKEFLKGEGHIRDLEAHFRKIYDVKQAYRWYDDHAKSIQVLGCNYRTDFHGPALRISYEMRYPGISRQLCVNVDRTVCFRLLFWPKIARSWFQRDRQYGWPSEEVIKEIEKAKCYLLPMHDPQQSERTSFRLSFSKSEEILCRNLSEEEFICYFIFKSVFYYYLGCITVDGHTMSSYVTKTTMFYKLEQSERSIWIPENRWENLGDLFERLFKYLKTGHLPNYFVPEINVLYTESPDLVADVTEKLADIKSDPQMWKEAFNDGKFDDFVNDFNYFLKMGSSFRYKEDEIYAKL